MTLRLLRNLSLALALALPWMAIVTGPGVSLHAADRFVPEKRGPQGRSAAGAPERPPMLLAQKTAKKKGAASGEATAGTAAGEGGLKFSRDIAPILVGNCIGCHNPERKRGKFDLTTFEKLMAGSDVEKVIEPGKPDESHLVLRLRGEETPKMPQGNNNNLSEEAIAKIESWVKAGARLDAGIDAKAPLKSYAPTAEALRAAELKKMSASDRDLMVIKVGNERWKQASPKNEPVVTSSNHFLLFSTLPKDRAVAAIKGMDTAYAQLNNILSKPGEPALDWAEKTSLFVFDNTRSFVEFVRSLENRELESGDTGTANFGTKEPYVAVIDPLGGREEPAAAGPVRKSPRTRKRDDSGGSERSVAGLLAEQMAMGILKAEKETPGWLCLGMGAYFAAGLDPRSAYVQKLRSGAIAEAQQGWTSRANDALGGQLRTDQTRAIGYALIDWMAHDPQTRRAFPAFVRGMIQEGGTRIDDVLQNVFGARRQDFLYSSGEWASHYGPSR